MREHEHNRPDDTVEVDLGALLVDISDLVEDHVEKAAARDISHALAMVSLPNDAALAALTDQLLTHCKTLAVGVTLIPEDRCPPQAAAAVRTWRKLVKDGPDDGTFGNWHYARALARAARDMLKGIRVNRTQRPEQPATFVGRKTMPPLPATEQP
ncbi:DUF6415 family natural product biosynthesis protein [Streptomyces sp. NPDC048018]|uniref:DUF6415 family natural product biosynthesis protein n=1 Tax=Streptomyces sp. NPDC048018 TaxID=3365499 RepID=UPI003716FF1A